MKQRNRYTSWKFLVILATVLCLPGLAASAAPSKKKSSTKYTPKKVIRSYSKKSTQVTSNITFSAVELNKERIIEAQTAQDLERIDVVMEQNGRVFLPKLPNFGSSFSGKVAGLSNRDEFVFYTIDPELQRFTKGLVKRVSAPHVAIVAMDPNTGKILAIAEKSNSVQNLSLHAGFPAASLFKLVTATAALEKTGLGPNSLVSFRGGNYSLDEWNYRPDAKKDRRYMSLSEALGRSVNPVFGRVALKYLNPKVLAYYSNAFGFNTDLNADLDLPTSAAYIPEDDYELSRTAAGFGQVKISPIHAAALMSAIANGGLLPRPFLVELMKSTAGKILYRSKPQAIKRIAQEENVMTLFRMMEKTTTIGTSRHEFYYKNQALLPGIAVAGKTGTLRGTNPAGLNNWFVGGAPIANPKIAVSVIVVDPKGISSKASRLGKLVIQKHLAK